ncbi:type 1 glutamine amidotransferase domain-containing protein [Sphingomonas sp. LHG3406-1]|uniref:type 1 glutamine amidotransferase domain-containing protein n=1 Tax=Sphingomonas sp. LHG3406-1 TaxID=2804617 RepID=UPI0026228FE4|nr:type 1 glutamine amidotransferase domain-containing protein [Sphingomonas sp. LHG3406-1]
MQTKVLIMASDGFEQDELFVPLERLRAKGCEVAVAAPAVRPIRATVLDDPGEWITPDLAIGQARVEEWDALLLPGGLINPDHLRTNEEAVALVRAFVAAGKAVGAICHGPWLLVEADALRGVRATGWRSIRTDLRNAGAFVEEGPVVRDGTIVTAVGPADSAAFADALLEAALATKP